MNTTPWTFGVEPLRQTLELAPLLRRVTGLVLSMESEDPAVADIIEELRATERTLAERGPSDLAPRIGEGASDEGRRVYIDHARDIGAFNPFFPEYAIAVDGERATGTVSFPIVFEGPPGIVHGGVIATFFDCAIQHHNCDLGVAGKTTSLEVRFRAPAPLEVPLDFQIDRHTDERRITSEARLFLGDATLCTATVGAVAGDRASLPAVSPRRGP